MDNLKFFFDDKTINSVVTLLVALYAALVAPKLPNYILNFFDNLYGKFILIFFIGYLASNKFDIALIVSIGFIITLHYLNN